MCYLRNLLRKKVKVTDKYMSVNFVFDLFLKRVKEKSKELMIVSTCRSGDELLSVTEKSVPTLWTTVVNLDEYQLNETEGRALAEDAGADIYKVIFSDVKIKIYYPHP